MGGKVAGDLGSRVAGTHPRRQLSCPAGSPKARTLGAPVEPPPGRWAFPPVDGADEDGLVGVGADLEPGTILAAYRRGLFPMPLGHGRHLGWWSPDPRAVLPLDGLRVSPACAAACAGSRSGWTPPSTG